MPSMRPWHHASVEDAGVKGLFSAFVPQMFNGVEFGGVRRELEQAQIARECARFTLMPAGAVEDHHNPILRMASRYLVKE